MNHNPVSHGARIRALWQQLASLPGGKWLFSLLLGWIVPYSGSVRPLVLALEPGFARVRIRDCRRVRNHLNSIHAIALANIAEIASGLAMMTALPGDMRGIVIGLSITYPKKARGTLTAECRCALPDWRDGDYEFESVVSDASGDIVARASARWRIGRIPV